MLEEKWKLIIVEVNMALTLHEINGQIKNYDNSTFKKLFIEQ